ncbi:MAG: ribonuclease P protein component [Christensenellaceae bacterium]|jgi:ribonuclease P protein component|nr:ribonuclease P protein component [Christensenellaceae bacterium]
MLPFQYRLKKRKTFAYLHKNGTKFSGEFVNLSFVFVHKLKIGFVCSKKVGNSIVRHRAIRLMREAVRPFLNKIKPSNIIFIAKENITRQHLVYLTLDIQKILSKSNLI